MTVVVNRPPAALLFGSGLSEDGWSVKLVVGAPLLLPLNGVIICATRGTLASPSSTDGGWPG